MSNGNIIRAMVAFMLMAMIGLMIGCNESTRVPSASPSDDEAVLVEAIVGAVEPAVDINMTTCGGKQVAVLGCEMALDSTVAGDVTAGPAVNQTYRNEARPDDHDVITSKNALRDRWINVALSDTGVQHEMATWIADGYQFSRRNSVVTSGKAVPQNSTDTVTVVVVDLVLAYLADPYEKFAAVEYACSPAAAAPVIQSSITSFTDPQDPMFDLVYLGTDEAGEHYIWVQDFMPRGWDRGFDWPRYRRCVAAHTVTSCAAAGIGCVAAGPGYPACVAAGCMAGAAAANVACALEQLWP